MDWALVDYENTGSLEAFPFSKYERVLVFCGPENTRIKLGALPSDRFSTLEFIRVPTTGRNNLDFHLAFHLGRLHKEGDEPVCFCIVSKDRGFDGLINHLKALGRPCKRVSAPISATTGPLSNEARELVSRLKSTESKLRPKRNKRLPRWIGAQFKEWDDSVAHQLSRELVRAGWVRESGGILLYNIDD